MSITLQHIGAQIPWALLVAYFAVPILKRQAKKIKNADLRASYMDIVRFVEMTCGGAASVDKKATAVEKITEQGLPLNQVLLEAIVHEVTTAGAKAATKQKPATATSGAS